MASRVVQEVSVRFLPGPELFYNLSNAQMICDWLYSRLWAGRIAYVSMSHPDH